MAPRSPQDPLRPLPSLMFMDFGAQLGEFFLICSPCFIILFTCFFTFHVQEYNGTLTHWLMYHNHSTFDVQEYNGTQKYGSAFHERSGATSNIILTINTITTLVPLRPTWWILGSNLVDNPLTC